MSMVKEELKVVFRKFKNGEVIALFPTLKYDDMGNIWSYVHFGQHGAASPSIVGKTKPATKAEYNDLLIELRGIYTENKLVIRKKLNIK